MKITDAKKSELINKIAQVLGHDPEDITEDKIFTHDLGCDSLDHVEMIMETEKILDINIKDDDAEEIKTVGDLFRLIEKY